MILCVFKGFLHHPFRENWIVHTRFNIPNQVTRCNDLGFYRHIYEKIFVLTHLGNHNNGVPPLGVAVFNHTSIVGLCMVSNDIRNLRVPRETRVYSQVGISSARYFQKNNWISRNCLNVRTVNVAGEFLYSRLETEGLETRHVVEYSLSHTNYVCIYTIIEG